MYLLCSRKSAVILKSRKRHYKKLSQGEILPEVTCIGVYVYLKVVTVEFDMYISVI